MSTDISPKDQIRLFEEELSRVSGKDCRGEVEKAVRRSNYATTHPTQPAEPIEIEPNPAMSTDALFDEMVDMSKRVHAASAPPVTDTEKIEESHERIKEKLRRNFLRRFREGRSTSQTGVYDSATANSMKRGSRLGVKADLETQLGQDAIRALPVACRVHRIKGLKKCPCGSGKQYKNCCKKVVRKQEYAQSGH